MTRWVWSGAVLGCTPSHAYEPLTAEPLGYPSSVTLASREAAEARSCSLWSWTEACQEESQLASSV